MDTFTFSKPLAADNVGTKYLAYVQQLSLEAPGNHGSLTIEWSQRTWTCPRILEQPFRKPLTIKSSLHVRQKSACRHWIWVMRIILINKIILTLFLPFI